MDGWCGGGKDDCGRSDGVVQVGVVMRWMVDVVG